MSKTKLPSQIASPNLQDFTQNDLSKSYDGVALRKERYVTPKGVKGETAVFFRVSARQLENDTSGKLEGYTKVAKSHVDNVLIKQWKSNPKFSGYSLETFLGFFAAQEQGNIRKSSDKLISANSFSRLNQDKKWISEQKLVRFVDDYNTQIPEKFQTR